MKQILIFISLLLLSISSFSQVKNSYTISFENVAHHEAKITATFSNLQPGKVVLQMAKKSPGSYGSYNFSQNIYNLKITGGNGKDLKTTQISLNEWEVNDHDGEIRVNYNLFGDTADGVFSQFSEDQTIINNPASFIYIEALESRPVELTYYNREDLGWKIATQLEDKGANTYEAKDLQEFMDSPTLLANFKLKERTIEAGSKQFKLKLAINDNSNDQLSEDLFDKIANVISEQQKVFGSFPNFDYDSYTFMASYAPYTGTNTIEHKNSSLILNSKPLSEIEVTSSLKMLSEMFLKTWNKTRITPISLKPFDLQKNTLTQEYWFAEGFSSYYALLTMCRAGIISHDKFLEEASFIVNDVITSSALQYNNTLEMSEQALFFAKNSINNTSLNALNLYIPYKDHGFVIALILDLELRNKDELNLDNFMSLFWSKYGKTNIGYSIENIYATLREYAGDSFAEKFFKENISEPTIYDPSKLLESVGVSTTLVELPYLGAEIVFNNDDLAEVSKYTIPGTPAYIGGLEKRDIIISINNRSFSNLTQLKNAIAQEKIGKKVIVKYSRNGIEKSTEIKLTPNPYLILTSLFKIGSSTADRKRAWIGEE